jgi:hypothetical protein
MRFQSTDAHRRRRSLLSEVGRCGLGEHPAKRPRHTQVNPRRACPTRRNVVEPWPHSGSCVVSVGACGGAAQPAGPSLPGQGRLRRRPLRNRPRRLRREHHPDRRLLRQVRPQGPMPGPPVGAPPGARQHLAPQGSHEARRHCRLATTGRGCGNDDRSRQHAREPGRGRRVSWTWRPPRSLTIRFPVDLSGPRPSGA